MLDDLGPSVHLAVHDADPVIALGSGDLLGAFGSNSLRSQGASMMIIPVVASVLTRPCTVLIETKDASNTARLLRQAASGWRAPTQSLGPDFRVSFYQVDDRDSWVWTMDLGGVVKLRLGIEVVDRYLVLRNIPWTASDRVVSTEKAGQNGALLTLRPAACRLQLPGLFATAADQEREAVMAGLGRLYPLASMAPRIPPPPRSNTSSCSASAPCRHRKISGCGRISNSPVRFTDLRNVNASRDTTRSAPSACCTMCSNCSSTCNSKTPDCEARLSGSTSRERTVCGV